MVEAITISLAGFIALLLVAYYQDARTQRVRSILLGCLLTCYVVIGWALYEIVSRSWV